MSYFLIDETVLRNLYKHKDKSHTVRSASIPISYMVKGYAKIAKDFPLVGDLDNHNIFFVKDYEVIVDQGKSYRFKDDIGINTQLIVIPVSTIVKLTSKDEKVSCFLKIDNEKLRIAYDDLLLKDEPLLKGDMTDKEKLAINWLLTDNVGVSSRTMCNKLFPNITMGSDSRDIPYDNSDFFRCMGFIKAIGGLTKEEWDKVASINHKWSALVTNWKEIEKNVDSENSELRKEAYNLIKECINTPKPKKLGI